MTYDVSWKCMERCAHPIFVKTDLWNGTDLWSSTDYQSSKRMPKLLSWRVLQGKHRRSAMRLDTLNRIHCWTWRLSLSLAMLGTWIFSQCGLPTKQCNHCPPNWVSPTNVWNSHWCQCEPPLWHTYETSKRVFQVGAKSELKKLESNRVLFPCEYHMLQVSWKNSWMFHVGYFGRLKKQVLGHDTQPANLNVSQQNLGHPSTCLEVNAQPRVAWTWKEWNLFLIEGLDWWPKKNPKFNMAPFPNGSWFRLPTNYLSGRRRIFRGQLFYFGAVIRMSFLGALCKIVFGFPLWANSVLKYIMEIEQQLLQRKTI